ncbi:MAG: tRNA-dihydrouridine synthase family protein [Candidatus Woesearchaeota archaeon]
MKKLYFAPINVFGHYVYRHFLLLKGADYVFSELIMPNDLSSERKFKIFSEDLDKTIFQIGVSSVEDVENAVSKLFEKFGKVHEININMGCPHSTMQKKKICSGILFDLKLMGELCKKLSSYGNFIASVKLRLGTSLKDIKIEEYLKVCLNNGVKKVYIHFRPLIYNYTKPVLKIENLKLKFPNMELIYNGDVDCYNKCVGYDGYMIGRAALSNPLIFSQIKQKINGKVERYDFTLNDSSLIKEKGLIKLSDEKKKVISEFVELCKKEGLSDEVVKRNLAWLLKGVSDKKEFNFNSK